MNRSHQYLINVSWTGNKGTGTSGYRAYERSFTVSVENKPDIFGSSDASFLGDAKKYNPEEMLVAALSSCHLLTYLHLCSDAGIIVTGYEDQATGTMTDEGQKGGYFKEVILHPKVTITDPSKIALADSLHEKAHHLCFIARSVNFPVLHEHACTAETNAG
jgi:organic hydroperoxide reductase OsmC/OhrA